MEINGVIAQDIVDSISRIIEEDINLMNDKAVIMASTDPARIGSYHGGAWQVIQLKKELTIHFDNEYEGALAGINLPVCLDDNVVGVIGITGEGETIWKYGEIIKKMTEILIKEHLYNQSKQFKNEKLHQFIDTILTSTYSDSITGTWLSTRLKMFDMRESEERRVIQIGFSQHKNDIASLLESYNHTSMLKQFFNEGDTVLYYGGYILMITSIVDKTMLISCLNELHAYLTKQMDYDLKFGIGNSYKHILDIKKSYNESRVALKAILRQDNNIRFYSEIDIELLIDSIPKNVAEHYFQKVFNDLNPGEINEYTILIETLVKENGSISSAAELLYIHKNTFQYRLNKVAKLTNYNPRRLDDLMVLYMALKLRRYHLL